jgi:trehalose 6-phosphate phosphatase
VPLLQALALRTRLLAVISGRDTDQLYRWLPLAGLLLVGNHGLEERRDGRSILIPEAAAFADGLERAAASIQRDDLPGPARLERKVATLAVHYRGASDVKTVREQLEAQLKRVARSTGLRLHAGRMVWELRPPVDVDKGTVITRLTAASGAKHTVYVGDDLTDRAAFRILAGLPESERLAVGVRSGEAPSETFAECDLLVDGVPGVVRLLERLLSLPG